MLHSHSSKCSEAIKQGDNVETCPQPPSQQVTRRRKAPGSTLNSPSTPSPNQGAGRRGARPTIQVQLGAKQTSRSTRSWHTHRRPERQCGVCFSFARFPPSENPQSKLMTYSPLRRQSLTTAVSTAAIWVSWPGRCQRDGERRHGGGNQMYPNFPSKFRSSWLRQT